MSWTRTCVPSVTITWGTPTRSPRRWRRLPTRARRGRPAARRYTEIGVHTQRRHASCQGSQDMSSKFRPASLLGVGAIAGAVLSMGITAMAQRDTRGILPLDELRQFSDVFGAI